MKLISLNVGLPRIVEWINARFHARIYEDPYSPFCLIAGNHVVEILKWLARRAKISYPGTNQIVIFMVGTNRFHPLNLSPKEKEAWELGTNRFVGVRLEPTKIGTNQVLTWAVDNDPKIAEEAQRLFVEFINLSPANGFFVASHRRSRRRSLRRIFALWRRKPVRSWSTRSSMRRRRRVVGSRWRRSGSGAIPSCGCAHTRSSRSMPTCSGSSSG